MEVGTSYLFSWKQTFPTCYQGSKHFPHVISDASTPHFLSGKQTLPTCYQGSKHSPPLIWEASASHLSSRKQALTTCYPHLLLGKQTLCTCYQRIKHFPPDIPICHLWTKHSPLVIREASYSHVLKSLLNCMYMCKANFVNGGNDRQFRLKSWKLI